MSDHETQGFKVVDRRQAVAEPTAAQGEPTVGASARPIPSEPDPNSAEQVPSTGETQSADDQFVQNEGTDSDGDADGRGMPDPSLLLSIAAMQLDVQTLTRLLIPVFDGQAWRAMGFLADPKTGTTQKDLPAAQLAIDCVQFLLGKVATGLADSERREMQRRLNDLRMNYVSKLHEG